MSATILILFIMCTNLQLVLLINGTASTQSSASQLDVDCFNDYITELTCNLFNTELNCSEYNLDVSYLTDFYSCSLEQINSSLCQCKFEVQEEFVVRESFKVNVLRRENMLFTRNITTDGSIKPKSPKNVSVQQTKNENFDISWKTIYKGPIFEELIPELTYSITGSKAKETKLLNKGLTSYEIVGRNLQPNSIYTVWVRVKCDLNQKFSDYSEPYTFKTPSSVQNNLRIITPMLCILLIICISTSFYCYYKIRSKWWDKIPTPKIAANFLKQVPNLLSFQSEFSPVCVDSPKPDENGENKLIVPFQFGIISQNSQQSFGKEVDSSQVIYAPTVYQSVESISSGNNVMSYNKEPNTTQCGVQHEGMKYSGIENKTYDKHSTDQFNNRNTFVLPFPKFPFPKINPTIEMDGPRTGFLDATNIKSTFFHNTPFITSCTPGNQNPFIDCGNKSVADASFGQVFLTAWDTIPVDSGYQDVQSLCINAAEPDCHNVKPSLQIIPSIEMDCSYHRV